MIQIDDKIVSTDIFEVRFCCDLGHCKGICCVEGNAGAPLDEEEIEILEYEYEAYKPYMKPEGIAAVERQGFVVVDGDGDLTTPLIGVGECAFSFGEDGVTYCAIERAYREGKTKFIKPISCHLYPIRLTTFSNGSLGLNYHRWSVCSGALAKGKREGVAMYQALKIPLIRRFGENFFGELQQAASLLAKKPPKSL